MAPAVESSVAVSKKLSPRLSVSPNRFLTLFLLPAAHDEAGGDGGRRHTTHNTQGTSAAKLGEIGRNRPKWWNLADSFLLDETFNLLNLQDEAMAEIFALGNNYIFLISPDS